jgi:hypothetical protein
MSEKWLDALAEKVSGILLVGLDEAKACRALSRCVISLHIEC